LNFTFEVLVLYYCNRHFVSCSAYVISIVILLQEMVIPVVEVFKSECANSVTLYRVFLLSLR
jgi:hypothetical protein